MVDQSGHTLYMADYFDQSPCILVYTTAMPCDKSSVTFSLWDQVGLWLVTYDEHPCDPDHTALYFCEGSGWGNKEATVVCREQGYLYGIGSELGIIIATQSLNIQCINTCYVLSLGYVQVVNPVRGYSNISCQGTEATLEECDIGDVSESCHFVAVVDHCSNRKFFFYSYTGRGSRSATIYRAGQLYSLSRRVKDDFSDSVYDYYSLSVCQSVVFNMKVFHSHTFIVIRIPFHPQLYKCM